MAYTLLIGNKNYSSWSLRPWLVLTEAGLPFTERLVSLQADAGKASRFAALPAGRVPCLDHDGLLIWDSLAICEYLAERHPGLWPTDPSARAVARSACAEMHSGFTALRSQMSLDVRSPPPQRRANRSCCASADCQSNAHHKISGRTKLSSASMSINPCSSSACRSTRIAPATWAPASPSPASNI